MNYKQIVDMVNEIYRDYKGMGRKGNDTDKYIAAIILRFYLRERDIDWEEVKWLWVEYLETGNLYLAEARGKAEQRINWEDIKATEDELVRWLHKGI